MEMFNEILIKLLEREGIHSSLQDFATIAAEAIEGECCHALGQIKAAAGNAKLSDSECRQEIIHVLDCVGA